MSVIAPKFNQKQFELPPEGPVWATLEEVRDLGEVATDYGPKLKVLFIWATDLKDREGEPIRVFEKLTNTQSPRGRLAPRLKDITGEVPDKNKEFDLSALEGTRAQLIIEHNQGEDRTWANIRALVRQKTAEEMASEARVKKVIASAVERETAPITDEDIPF